MRIHFAGSFSGLAPTIIMFTSPGTYSFDKTLYPDYAFYDVMVVGAGGGSGGGLEGPDPDHVNWNVINFGGAGGGGGSHRLQGLLEHLANSTEIIVGAAGANGTDGEDVPDNATDGEDGEASSFGDFVKASGGKGGRHSYTLSYNENQIADGGDGGIGNSATAGGGGKGGICGLNNDPENVEPLTHVAGTNGESGSLVAGSNGMIGGGGGGGAGGSVRYDTDTQAWQLQPPYPTIGGRGSYNPDETVFSPGGYPEYFTPPGSTKPFKAKPGKGGGARVTPLNKSNATYGDSRRDGIVIVRLTAE